MGGRLLILAEIGLLCCTRNTRYVTQPVVWQPRPSAVAKYGVRDPADWPAPLSSAPPLGPWPDQSGRVVPPYPLAPRHHVAYWPHFSRALKGPGSAHPVVVAAPCSVWNGGYSSDLSATDRVLKPRLTYRKT